jgi:cell division protein FtsI (penicillin-binding protein 3)
MTQHKQRKQNSRLLIRLRYIAVASAIVFFAAGIFKSAMNTTIVHAKDWNEKANKELLKVDTIRPQRGDVLACDGSVLATNLTYYTARIDFRCSKFMANEFRESLDSLCDSLAKYHPIRDRAEWKTYLSKQINLPDTMRSMCYLLLKDITHAQNEQLKTFPFFRRSRNRNKTGLTSYGVMKRSYPYGDMARRSVGRVGEQPNGQVHGVSGLEYALDSLLYGVPGLAKKVPLTHKITNWTDVPPKNGYTITTTIDIAMQDIVENELNDMLTTTEAQWGTAILMEVSTGDIKAISNLERDSVSGKYIEAMNRALQGFEPGSVMKTISMVVALEDGFVTNLDEMYSIGSSYVFGGGSPIRDTHSPAMLPVRRFLEYSSNIGMTKLVAPHYKDDPNAFRERLRKLGFLDRFNTGIAGEQPPYFPVLDIKAGGLVSLGRQTYGYASQIPPLYMCAFYNAVANDGKFVRPRIVKGLSSEKGDSILPVTYVREHMCSAENARKVREMLHEVIYGPAGTARMLKNDLVELAGKTGTSKIAREAPKVEKKDSNDTTTRVPKAPTGYLDGRYRLAFCGFFPYDHPQYTCMVLISKPAPQYRGAGYTSGIVFKNIALKMYSRGMFGNSSDYRTEEMNDGSRPMVYANTQQSRIDALKGMLGTKVVERIKSPNKTPGVPNVRGLSARDAVVTLERAGYNVNVQGVGFVSTQTPAAGTPAPKGTRINLKLTH